MAEDGPSLWDPGAHMGDLDGDLGSWLQPHSAPSCGGLSGSEPADGTSLSLSSYPYLLCL